MDKKYILFDLDGTLTDPKIGITSAVASALEHCGYPVPEDLDTLCPFIGPPLHDSFSKYYGADDDEAEKLVESYRKYYRPKGIFECTVYDDIPDLLISLKESGKKIILATSKPEDMAEDILDHFGLIGYFDGVYGATHDRTRTDKAAVIAYAVEEFGLTERDQAVMIGDREYDILGAKSNGISAIGVEYGYCRDPKEFAKADAVAKTVAELKNILL